MNIVHLSLASAVTEHMSYQDNVLSEFHKRMEHNVTIISDCHKFKNGIIVDTKPEDRIMQNGVRLIRLPYVKGLVPNKLRKVDGLYDLLEILRPDIIFQHGVQTLETLTIRKFIRKYPNTRLYIDNHADYVNSATNCISKYVLHGIIWRLCAKKIIPYTNKFYGVMPSRVNFLVDMYKIPQEKVELLVMGAEDDKVIEAKEEVSRNLIRKELDIKDNDFLIITGGKIDLMKKQTLMLMEAVRDTKYNIKLIIFGSVIAELENNFKYLCDNHKIKYIGWIKASESYKFFAAADLVVFPGSHSVFWEQVVGLGIPMVVKYWQGTTHIDVGGNCAFLYKDSVEEIQSIIERIYNDNSLYNHMKSIAENQGIKLFSYKDISKRSIEET